MPIYTLVHKLPQPIVDLQNSLTPYTIQAFL